MIRRIVNLPFRVLGRAALRPEGGQRASEGVRRARLAAFVVDDVAQRTLEKVNVAADR